MPAHPMQTVWDLLGTDARAFALYCYKKQTDDAIAISYMLENINQLDLGSAAVQGYVLPTLLAAGVITQPTIDRINEFMT